MIKVKNKLNILLIYRYNLSATKDEFLEQYNKFKNENVTFVAENDFHRNKIKLDFKMNKIITIKELLEGELDNMQFDYIVGNPPYGDGSDSEAGNLYVDITKKCLNMLTSEGEMIFLTPTTIAQSKKTGFTLSGIKGLKLVDYTANESFDVGVKILKFHIDRKYIGAVSVIDVDHIKTLRHYRDSMVQSKEKFAFDLFEKLKTFDTRMFINVQTGNNKSLTQSKENKYKIIVNEHKNKVEYTSILPRLHGKKKLIISLSRDISKDNMTISADDYLGVVTDISKFSSKEINNLKLFLMSKTVSNITKKYKLIYKTGFMNILRFFPKIDVDKEYTETDIERFFNLTQEEIRWLNND